MKYGTDGMAWYESSQERLEKISGIRASRRVLNKAIDTAEATFGEAVHTLSLSAIYPLPWFILTIGKGVGAVGKVFTQDKGFFAYIKSILFKQQNKKQEQQADAGTKPEST